MALWYGDTVKELGGNIAKQAGVAAILTALFTFLINYQQQSRADFGFITDNLKEQISDLKSENEILRLEVFDLKAQATLFKSMQYESPIPTWMKDLNGRMISLNKAYEEIFLIPNGFNKYDYIGKTDVEFWGQAVNDELLGQSYRNSDVEVITQQRTIRGLNYGNIDGKRIKFIIYKYPIWTPATEWNERKLIGVGGVAIPLDESILNQ